MSISFLAPDSPELKPRIVVFGVGGAGGNAVNNMLTTELEGVDFVVANTDAQALAQNLAPRKVQLGAGVTLGLGAGSKPEIGAQAAEASSSEIEEILHGCHMAFITAGMGGGTGTGAAPVIARIAREMGILTVGVVTKPFHFEGDRRMRQAEAGVAKMQEIVDTLIVIPNQNLFRIANEKTTLAQSFAMADEVLHSGVRGITDLMIVPGLMNLDFADVRTVMMEMGKAMMGTGEAEGPKRALDAAEAAISNPLLDDVSMKGAKGVLIHITGGPDLTLFEADEAANRIRQEVDSEANIKVGSTFDAKLEGRIRVSVVATGIDAVERAQPKPAPSLAPAVKLGQGLPPSRPQPSPVPPAPPQPEPTPMAYEPPRAPVAPLPTNPVHVMQETAAAHMSAPAPVSAPAPIAPTPAPAPVRPAFDTVDHAIAAHRAAPQPQPQPHYYPAPEAPRPTIRFDDAAIEAEERGGDMGHRPGTPMDDRPGLMGAIGGLFTRSKARREGEAPTNRYQPELDGGHGRANEPRFADPQPRATARTVKGPETPSLFSTGPAEDPLEIPAFLRRQAGS